MLRAGDKRQIETTFYKNTYLISQLGLTFAKTKMKNCVVSSNSLCALQYWAYATGQYKEEIDKTLVRDKHNRPITYV